MQKTYRRRQLAGLVAGLALGLIVVVAVLTLRGVATAQQQNTDTIELIQEQQQQTQELIAVVNNFTTLVLACADRPGTQTAGELQACALDLLAEQTAQGKGSR